jgi:hypothetical protein
MKTSNIYNLIYSLYPVLITLLVVLVLFLMFWPRVAGAQTVIENNNSSTIVNNVSTKSSTQDGQSEARVKVYTEVNGEVVSDEEFIEEGSGDVSVEVKQTVQTVNDESVVETEVDINDHKETIKDPKNSKIPALPADKQYPMTNVDNIDVKKQSNDFIENESIDNEADCNFESEVAVCAPPETVGNEQDSDNGIVDEEIIKISWWQEILINFGNWWNNLFSYFV